MSVDIAELNALTVDLGSAGVVAQVRAGVAVRRSGRRMRSLAEQFAPRGATGRLVGEMEEQYSSGGLSVAVGSRATRDGFPYPRAQEFGTSRHAPRAHLGPALDRTEPEFVKEMEQIGFSALRRGL